jgi:hypothetical protein
MRKLPTSLAAFVLAAGAMLMACLPVVAQTDGSEMSLGDVARSLHRDQDMPAHTVIDNDNLSQVVEEVEARRLSGVSLMYSIDESGKGFKIQSPDVTCSLSFSAQASALLSDNFVAQKLPGEELLKLDGPATIKDGTLQIAVYNGSAWDLREITVGITLVRSTATDIRAASTSSGHLIPAAQVEPVRPQGEEKRSDLTVLYHLKGSAPPAATTVFQETLGAPLSPGQEWHWAIVEAKGLPPH